MHALPPHSPSDAGSGEAGKALLQRLQAQGALWSEYIPDDTWLVLAPPGFEDTPAAAGHTVVRL